MLPKYIVGTDTSAVAIETCDHGIMIFQGHECVYFTAEEAVDIATKIINYCYPFTRPTEGSKLP